METRELAGASFRCLEGCGFCCTFQPEVSTRELALLRKRFQPRGVPVVVGEGRTYLALQNRCGACALLSARGCTAYDLRPAHCRYFPFHVYFGETTEVMVNYTCRGVLREGGDLSAAFQASVLGVAKADEIEAHERAAKDAHGEFKRRARRAGKWGDVAAVAERAVGGLLFTGDGIERAARLGAEDATRDDLHEDALRPFGAPDVTKRPFHLAADLKWITFERDARGLQALEMDETGALLPRGRADGLDRWADLPPAVADGLVPYLRSLVARGSFAGSVYALVDDSGYKASVEEATWWRLAEIAADLAARVRVLAALGEPDARLADEAARFYDSAFLDAPTIGGWL